MEIIKKIDSTSSNGYTPKIIETPHYTILNSQLYDKSDFNPVKFDMLDIKDITFTSWMSIFKRYIVSNYRHEGYYFEQVVKCEGENYGMMEDIKYPNRFYLVGQRGTYGGFLRCYEEQVNENTGKHTFKLLHSRNIGDNTSTSACGKGVSRYAGSYAIIHQEDDYLIVKQSWPSVWINQGNWSTHSYTNACCFKLNKKDFSTVDISRAESLEQDASYNYFYMEHWTVFDYIFVNWHLNHYVLKYDSKTNTTVTIYNNTETGCDITANPVKIGDYYYYLVDEYKRTGKYGYQLCRIKINFFIDQNGTCDYEYIDIEDNHKMDIYRASVMGNVTHPLIHDCLSIQLSNGNNYMIVVARSQPNGEWYYPQHKLVVLRIEEDKAVITQVVEFKSNPCRGVLSYYEEPGHADVLITLHTSCFMIWKFDYEQEKYVNTFIRTGQFYSIGLDEQQRLYAQDTATGIQMFDKIETSTAKVYFEEEMVDEDAETTKLCFWTKNYFNEYTKEDVIINLYNGITFEDESIEKEFQTSTSGPTEVTVRITATNNVKAQATIAVISRTPEE